MPTVVSLARSMQFLGLSNASRMQRGYQTYPLALVIDG
jgi:hypothetical protein